MENYKNNHKFDGDSSNWYLYICPSIKPKSVGLIEKKTNHHHLISRNEIVYDVVFIFYNLRIPKKYFHV